MKTLLLSYKIKLIQTINVKLIKVRYVILPTVVNIYLLIITNSGSKPTAHIYNINYKILLKNLCQKQACTPNAK